jgi:cytoskeletal protein RodZ
MLTDFATDRASRSEAARPHDAEHRPQGRRSRRLHVVAIVTALTALGLQLSVGWSMWGARHLRQETSTVRAQRDRATADLANDQATLHRTKDEAAVAADALASALAKLGPGVSPEANDADLTSTATDLANAEDALAQLSAAATFDKVEHDRLVGCLTDAKQALDVAQTSPPNTSSLYAIATESCRVAGSGAFTSLGRP